MYRLNRDQRFTLSYNRQVALMPHSSCKQQVARVLTRAALRKGFACQQQQTDIGNGYFTDPDGHLWEIVWNPQMEIRD